MQITLMIGCGDRSLAQAIGDGLADEDPIGITCDIVVLEQAAAAAALARPDVLCVVHTCPQQDTSHIVGSVQRCSPRTRVLLLCETCTHQSIIEAIQQGASGCMLRSSAPSLLAKAVRAVHAGETWYGRQALLQALQSQICPLPLKVSIDEQKLTQREDEILRLIGSGLTNKEIARRLEISDKTVKTHLHRVYVKLNQSGRYKAFLAQPEARGRALQ